MHSSVSAGILLFAATWVVACGGHVTEPSSSGGSQPTANGAAAAPDASSGGEAEPPPAPAPFACGSAICTETQYCITPCCEPDPYEGPCVAKTNGTCPPGYADSPAACAGPSGPCEYVQCTPPPPYCVDDPSQTCASGIVAVTRNLQCICGL
jgi:hypothetical protein